MNNSQVQEDTSQIVTGIECDQRTRKRRLAMSFLFYLVTLTVVVFCWYQELISLRVVGYFAAFAVLINGGVDHPGANHASVYL